MAEKRRKPSKAGRPRGKRSDPNYILCCGLVRKTTLRRVKHHLLDADKELSELMEELFQAWLDNQSD